MGVNGLWTLLTPVGRPVQLETMEGKAMAIDSSIWLYQFQATMRDKEGHVLNNAHIVGFLRRITKLLFYGIKPIFVFDGAAPELKRMTLAERKKKREGADATHAKVAEKLLAAQMRREAVKHAQSAQSKGKGKADPNGEDDIVYLEDIDSKFATPSKKKKTQAANPSPSSAPKAKFRDHDPYRLPEVDMSAKVLQATSSSAPDPRLATEDELRAFIEEMRPEDFDVGSEAFRDLPTEVQYEIVGDLRLKSRQTSYSRLEHMLKTSKTPLDFSKQQIMNLKQRNSLTQQLLTTTDTIGKANIEIPVRIASERNRQYVLVKNEGPEGGWILGIRDDGTAQKPILIDHEPAEDQLMDDSDDDMEEVDIPAQPIMDPDLRQYQRETALHALSRRQSSKAPTPLPNSTDESDSGMLFQLSDEEDMLPDDQLMAFALQESLNDTSAMPPQDISSSSLTVNGYDEEEQALAKAIAMSLQDAEGSESSDPPPAEYDLSTVITSPPQPTPTQLPPTIPRSPPQLSAAADAEASVSNQETVTAGFTSAFGTPSLLLSSPKKPQLPSAVRPTATTRKPPVTHTSTSVPIVSTLPSNPVTVESPPQPEYLPRTPDVSEPDDDEDMEDMEVVVPPEASPAPDFSVVSIEESPPLELTLPEQPVASSSRIELEDLDTLIPWSRSPSPVMGESIPAAPTEPQRREQWDAAQEMDIEAEEGGFAQFLSQVKGKDLAIVQREIDEEISALNREKKGAMRDAENTSQQMIAQIMTLLRLFGIPYITAPMEAEAQCAQLVSLGLADGIITDDSDVFLFGGQQVFKNMFNQSKTVECFLLSDLSVELGLDRDTLVRLAYLLGSDYVGGVPGVGPVVAMELLKEFPGKDGLHKFKDWWFKVQSGRDKDPDTSTTFRKRFKKKFKELYLPAEWPSSIVRDAYYHPVVDESDEPFKWGLPDLDGLRQFLFVELRWKQAKVDEILLPIIQKMSKRRQAVGTNKQGNLNDYVSGNIHAPRRRQAYKSKRLQDVVTEFRKKRKLESSNPSSDSEPEEPEAAPPKKKVTKITTTGKSGRGRGRGRGRGGRGRAAAGKKATEESDDESGSEAETENRGDGQGEVSEPPPPRPRPRPRPKRGKPAAVDESAQL